MNNTDQVQKSAIQVFEEILTAEQIRLNKEFMESIQARMVELNMSQSDMAYTLGKSRAYISKLFSQDQNLTIKTMVELGTTLEMKVSLKLRPNRALSAGKWVTDPDDWFGTMTLRCGNVRPGSVAKKAVWGLTAANDNFELDQDHDLALAAGL
jgi:plasmid maintenance system antidote protein VapI